MLIVNLFKVDFAREVEGLEQEIRDLRRKMIEVNDGDEGRFSRDEIQGTGCSLYWVQ